MIRESLAVMFLLGSIATIPIVSSQFLAYAHNSTPNIQEDSLVVTASPSTVNRGNTVTITATVLAHRTGGGASTNWSILLTVPSGYAISSGANPQSKATSSHASAMASWIVTAPSIPSGPDTFTVTASAVDASLGTALSGSPEVDSFAVTTVNRMPFSTDDTVTIAEDSVATTINVLTNDTDADNDTLIINSISSQPSNGTAEITDSNTTITYSPDANFFGTDNLSYTIQDAYGGVATGTVTIIVTSVNDAPVAFNDVYATDEDTLLSAVDIGVTYNDTDVEGDDLSSIMVDNVSNGTLTLYSNGTFSYLPAFNFNGHDNFTYIVNDGTDNSTIATANITISPINDAPNALDDSYFVDEDDVLEVLAAAGVLANDTDAEGDVLSPILIDDVVNGILTLNVDGSFTYSPDPHFNGADSFTYKASDGNLNSATMAVNITIDPVNDAPIATNDSYTTNEDTTLFINSALGLLENDSDIENSTLSATIVDDVSHGILTLYTNGSFTYIPDANYNGADYFTYKASDGFDNSTAATVSIMFNPIDDGGTGNGGDNDQDEEGTNRDTGNTNRRDNEEADLAAKRITHEESYFDNKPLEKVQIQSHSLLDSAGASFSSISKGEPVTFSYNFRNYQQKSQQYCFIVQIIDEQDLTVDIQFSKGELARGGRAEIEQDWISEENGDYIAKVFIWDKLDNPSPLSDMDIKVLRVR